jgi:hypothetical protein
MKLSCRFFLILLTLSACQKDVVVDKRTLMSAKINASFLSANDATAILEKSSFFSGKGQLTITGEDDSSKISLIIKDYTGDKGSILLDNSNAIAVYFNKSSNKTDTAANGLLRINDVIDNYYSIPEIPASQYSTGQIYKSEVIVGSFEFITRNNVSVTDGIFGISFNK